MNSDGFNNDNTTYCTLSYELLILLQWLSQQEGGLKKLIQIALKQGLEQELLEHMNDKAMPDSEEVHCNIIDFFNTLEGLLAQVLLEQTEQRAREQQLQPSIDHIDTSVCDSNIVQRSVEKATNKISDNPEVNPKEILYKELLKRWNPKNKNMN